MVSAGHPASPWDGGAGAARQMPALISHCAFPHPAPASQNPFPLRLFWRHSAFQHLNFSFCTHFLPPRHQLHLSAPIPLQALKSTRNASLMERDTAIPGRGCRIARPLSERALTWPARF